MIRTPIRVLVLVILFVWAALPAAAQTGGQFCVRAFEDRNGSGARDGGEPLLTRGLAVNLLNAEGVTVASGLLESSPTAAQGTLCFQFLPAGQYTMVVTSAELTATTGGDFTAVVSDGAQPVLFEFGAQRPVIEPTMPAAAPQDSTQLQRIGLSVGGALIAVIGMLVLGLLIYLVALRPSRPAPAQRVATPTPASIPPVAANDDTGKVSTVK
jgi:ABC-type Na+ efflux pump permease subunit